MKKLIVLLLLSLFAAGARAQTFNELFRQKKTQKKYLIKQVAALEIYLGYVKKGYDIAKKGLKTIGDIKNAELGLHKGYFSSLENVRPEIKNCTKVADIIALQINIMDTYGRVRSNVRESGAFSPEEAGYIDRVFARLLDGCAATIDELTMITTAGKLEMKDGERLERIGALYTDMLDKYTFAHSFGNGAMVLAAGRAREKNDIRTGRALNGIKNQ